MATPFKPTAGIWSPSATRRKLGKFDDVDANRGAQIEGAVAVNLGNHIVNGLASVRAISRSPCHMIGFRVTLVLNLSM
jgi:hypothetical protein